MTLSLLEQPKKQRLQEQIAEQIKKLIFSQKIEVGQKLPSERELAKTLNVSRVVIREALLSLEQAGFIEVKQGTRGGSYVTYNIYKPLLDSIYDLFRDGSLSLQSFFDARYYIERISVELAVEKATQEDIRNLEQINDKFLETDKPESFYPEINLKFHLALAEIGGNPLIKLFIGSIWKMQKIIYANAYTNKELFNLSYHTHKKVIKALKQTKKDQAIKMISEDILLFKKLKINPDQPNFIAQYQLNNKK